MNRLNVYDISPSESIDAEFVHSSEPLTKTSSLGGDPELSANALNNTRDTTSPIQSTSKVKQLLSNWRLFVFIVTPLALLPILIALPDSQIARCAYVLLLMAIYWCTEALPLPATALLPLVLAPLLGIMKCKAVAINYLTDLNFLFVGGLMFAVAVEKWNLHKRIALGVLIIVGTKPKMLLLGFISVTGFLSMWLSNTATTAMMIPIAQAVLIEMWKFKKYSGEGYQMASEGDDKEIRITEEYNNTNNTNNSDNKAEERSELRRSEEGEEPAVQPRDMDHSYQNLGKAISLCICYAANIGGTGTLTGTGPNLIIGSVMNTYFPSSNDITFGSWMLFATPLMLLCLAVCWLTLVCVFLGPRSLIRWREDGEFSSTGGRQVLRREYNKLGPIRFAEVILIIFFIILVMLWLWRDPKFTTGWSVLFKKSFVSDATTGIFICTFLYAFPSSFPCMKSHRSGLKLGEPLLDWVTVQKKLPWGVIILLGGGFALADLCKESGLSDWLGCQLGALDSIPKAALVFICGAVMTLFTEFTSNTSSASIFLPILAQLSVRLSIHPLYLLIPVTICSSYAFAFPVATPPNAIVFSYGFLRVIDMVKAGMMLNLFCLLAVMLAINTWGNAYFGLQSLPSWVNSTAVQNSCT